ncbi:hypothetical protein MYX76_14025 [Desulfobacterota bacterium AH_259_B03_O07]|nr:hypothetical protein [Desulfobacterota bacterium AH_259_B03_O07]
MGQKRIRTKLFRVWLHPKELEFLNNYAEENMFTASEVIRTLIHGLMKSEGYKIKEPLLPKQKIKKRRE